MKRIRKLLMWEEAEVPGENARKHDKNMYTDRPEPIFDCDAGSLASCNIILQNHRGIGSSEL